MERNTIFWKEQGVTAKIAEYAGNEAKEMHVIFSIEPCFELFEGQLQRFQAAYSLFQAQFPTLKCVLKRYFLSDSTNQSMYIPKETRCAVSFIQQPPLNGSKLAVWCYLVGDVKPVAEQGELSFEHNGYSHYFHTNLFCPTGDSFHQTREILNHYEQKLTEKEIDLYHNCIRTWFYIRDVDTQYAGMVKARRENFTEQGLTEHTHYIASTGIGGNPAHPSALVQMDAYAIKGLDYKQIRFINAPTHLNPTYEYGVTFERGTLVEYGDRSHIFISGTASIDNKGDVLHIGNIEKQCLRMWENVEMLLKEGGATYDDVVHIIVYLRDSGDYEIIRRMYEERFPQHPVIITWAPVCRPTWLIEMECIAITPKGNRNYRNF